jgi:hypothetical protein
MMSSTVIRMSIEQVRIIFIPRVFAFPSKQEPLIRACGVDTALSYRSRCLVNSILKLSAKITNNNFNSSPDIMSKRENNHLYAYPDWQVVAMSRWFLNLERKYDYDGILKYSTWIRKKVSYQTNKLIGRLSGIIGKREYTNI